MRRLKHGPEIDHTQAWFELGKTSRGIWLPPLLVQRMAEKKLAIGVVMPLRAKYALLITDKVSILHRTPSP